MMETGEEVPAGRLDVSLDAFVTELQRANGIVTKRSTGDAILAFDGCELSVGSGGAEFSVPAWGYWSGAVRTSSRWLTGRDDMLDNFRMNCIPEAILDGQAPDYEAFLEERRRLMALKIQAWFESL